MDVETTPETSFMSDVQIIKRRGSFKCIYLMTYYTDANECDVIEHVTVASVVFD